MSQYQPMRSPVGIWLVFPSACSPAIFLNPLGDPHIPPLPYARPALLNGMHS